MSQLGQPKIFVPIALDGETAGGETLFAKRVRKHVYRVDCVPLFVDLRYGDVVECDESDPGNLPVMIKLLERQDALTAHVLFTKTTNVATVVAAIEQVGAHVERVEGRLYAINVATDHYALLESTLDGYPSGELRWWLDDDPPPDESVIPHP